jgi:hypothetical protein
MRSESRLWPENTDPDVLSPEAGATILARSLAAILRLRRPGEGAITTRALKDQGGRLEEFGPDPHARLMQRRGLPELPRLL